jgi:hypothetical protein
VSLGGAVFALLLAASLISAFIVVRARDPDLALEVTKRACDPEPCVGRDSQTFAFDPEQQTALITFFVRKDDPEAFVGIVDEDDEPVRTLDGEVALSEGEEATYRWDGRDDAGALVSPASYYLRVELPNRDRDMVWPRRMRVVPSPGAEQELAPG